MKPLLAALILAAAPAVAFAAAPPPAASVPVSPGTAAPRPTADPLKAVDADLLKCEDLAAQLERAQTDRAKGTGCPPGVRAGDLASDLRGGKLAKLLGGTLPEENGAQRDWQVYHVCRALAASDPGPCVDAGAIAAPGVDYIGASKKPVTYRENCEIAYYQTRAEVAAIRKDPRFMDVCREALPHLAPFKDDAAVAALCIAWRDDAGGSREGMVAALQAGLARPMSREYAVDAVREISADPSYCGKVSDDYLVETCRETASFRLALAASDAGKCRGGLCRALMGQGAAACDPYAKTFLRVACTQDYANDYARDVRKRFEDIAGKAESDLTALDAGASGPRELAEIGSRLDRLYDLRARLDRAAAAYAPLAAHAAAAPAEGEKRSP